ncbi:nucleotidyltransferase domain-containing protein [Streptomyces sp. NPDC091259]|uniref:nucleotidyltransferase domain-containing protein n=1 Tax=Streptomyces sp. NPDC091259 TaxID=3365976 RepID=UPI0038182332
MGRGGRKHPADRLRSGNSAEGVELDVHVIEVEAGVVVPSCDVPWPFDAGSLEGRGVIDGRHVACLSAQTEVAMHRGYELPETHERDEALLRQLD